MIRVFTLLDALFLENFEYDYKELVANQNLESSFEFVILNLNVKSENLTTLSNYKNLNIVEFYGESLFNYIYENTQEVAFFLMPHLIYELPNFLNKIDLCKDQILLRKNVHSKNLERVMSCIKDKSFYNKLFKEIKDCSIFSDSYFGTTLYSSDLIYGTKSFYKSLCDTFKDINDSQILVKDSHYKFDLILNLTLLQNKFYVNSV